MPKFELNPRTGIMEPKKDDQIYFAQSQGGGLRIDDHKNNVKYVIERDGRITNLFALDRNKSINLYDMRDARIIADRVVRMFGRDHKYANYEYFLKNHIVSESVIKTYDQFINETIWGGSMSRALGKEIKQENGKQIGELEDGTLLFIDNNAMQKGNVVDFDGKNYLHIDETDDYIAVINDGDKDYYYRYDPDIEGVVNMVECFDVESALRTEGFGFLMAFMQVSGSNFCDLDGMHVHYENNHASFDNGDEYMIWKDLDDVRDYTINYTKELLDGCYDFKDGSIKKDIDNWRDYFNNDFIDEDELENIFRDMYESDFDDMSIDDLIDDLIRYEIIEDTEEYFELDEDGNPDHDLPKFEMDEYKDYYVEHMMENIDVVDEYLLNFGYEGFDEYIDFDKLSELIVNEDGIESVLGAKESYVSIDKESYYVYKMQ